jgi:thiamine pyrophosphokinase
MNANPPPADRPTNGSIAVLAVITGSADLDPLAVAAIPTDSLVVGADGGFDHALAAGLEPAYLIGDLDSVSAVGLAWAAEHAEVVRHPVDKAATDTELAVAFAATFRPERLILAAGRGDRVDHAVAALGALGATELAGIAHVEAWWGDDHLTVIHGPGHLELDAPAGTTFSLLSMHGACTGVTVTGARWPLTAADLGPLVGLGVSNVVIEPPVAVAVHGGILTIIVPGGVA